MGYDFADTKPIYHQIADHIKSVLASGELGPGVRIPPVRELASSFSVNPNTAQKALQELEREGYLHTDRTSGRRVTENKQLLNSLRDDSRKTITENFINNMSSLGISKDDLVVYLKKYLNEHAN